MDNCPEHRMVQGPGYSDGQGCAEGNPLSNDCPPHVIRRLFAFKAAAPYIGDKPHHFMAVAPATGRGPGAGR